MQERRNQISDILYSPRFVMKAISLSLVCAALSLGTVAVNVRSRSQATTGKEKCPSAQEVSSSTFVVDGHEITRQSFTCPVPGALAGRAQNKGRSIARSLFEKRSAAECRTPSPECQCGTDCEFLRLCGTKGLIRHPSS